MLWAAWPVVARAQETPAPKPEGELRADAIVNRTRTVVQIGAGVQIPAGYYARIGVVGALGADATVADGSNRQLNARVDVLGRFLLDPFRQTPWGLSLGAGVSVRAEPARPLRPFLVAVIDLEGPRAAGGVSPALQVGLGGGVRIGGALRWGHVAAR